jgi:hypothetical protein
VRYHQYTKPVFGAKTLHPVEAIRSVRFVEPPTRVVDPDPHGSELSLVGYPVDPDPDPGEQNDPQKFLKSEEILYLRCWMFSVKLKASSIA